jgi:hypothetical protein
MSSSRRLSLIRSVSHTLAALFNSSADFRREWKRYDAASRGGGIEGRWQGEWISEVNGHHGELKGAITKSPPAGYKSVFQATFSKILHVCYEVVLSAREQEDAVELEGQADLGRLAGGVYRYKGRASPERFDCSYECKYDHGTFRMKRVD